MTALVLLFGLCAAPFALMALLADRLDPERRHREERRRDPLYWRQPRARR